MTTRAGTQDNMNDLITALIKLEKDALQAYDKTIQKLDNVDLADRIREFRSDHLDHINSLSSLAKSNNIEIPSEGPKSMLTKGKVIMGDMKGDKGILKAMASNEDDTVQAYQNALQNDSTDARLKSICSKALEDERRHRTFMEEQTRH